MSDPTPTNGTPPALCRLCGKTFSNDPLKSAMIVGDNPQAKMQHIHAILSPLMKHLTLKHKAELHWTQLMGGEYAGLLAMNFFETHAPQVEAQRDYARWKIHTLTRRAHVTDERIRQRFRAVYSKHIRGEAEEETPAQSRDIDWVMESKFGQMVIAMIQDVRDVLTERDRYQMTDPPPTIPETGKSTEEQPAQPAS